MVGPQSIVIRAIIYVVRAKPTRLQSRAGFTLLLIRNIRRLVFINTAYIVRRDTKVYFFFVFFFSHRKAICRFYGALVQKLILVAKRLIVRSIKKKYFTVETINSLYSKNYRRATNFPERNFPDCTKIQKRLSRVF